MPPAAPAAVHAPARMSPAPALDDKEGEHYFRTTPLASQSSSVSTANSRSAPVKPLHLYFSGKDLPEPDTRSRASYAVVYIARETPVDPAAHDDTPLPTPRISDVPTSPPGAGHHHHQHHHQQKQLQQQHPHTQKQTSASSSPHHPLHLSALTAESDESLVHSPRRRTTHTSVSQRSSTRSDAANPAAAPAAPAAPAAATAAAAGTHAPAVTVAPKSRSTPVNFNPSATSPPTSPLRRAKKHASTPSTPLRLVRSRTTNSTRSQDLPERAKSATGAPARPVSPSKLPLPPPPSRSATAPRAPDRAVSNFAPPQPTVHVDRHGARVRRTAWTKVGSTEVARKQGRDVEFSRAFRLDYSPAHRVVVRLAFFDCTSAKVDRRRLIGTSEFYLSAAFAAHARPVTFPLRFLPVTRYDHRRSARIPDGTLVVVAAHVDAPAKKYRLDVECNRILRSASLSTVTVRRVFYTIHAILDDDDESDVWTLIFRSLSVQMIHKKRDGGSLEYNYFSSRRLRAAPGVILEEQVTKGSDQDAGLRATVAKALGFRRKDCFFSLPGADIQLGKPEMRLKLSLFEDNGLTAGFHLIADTCFSIADLKARELGDSSAIKVHANVVGRAQLKYVEIAPDPRYFCLALCMQGVR